MATRRAVCLLCSRRRTVLFHSLFDLQLVIKFVNCTKKYIREQTKTLQIVSPYQTRTNKTYSSLKKVQSAFCLSARTLSLSAERVRCVRRVHFNFCGCEKEIDLLVCYWDGQQAVQNFEISIVDSLFLSCKESSVAYPEIEYTRGKEAWDIFDRHWQASFPFP